MDKITLQHQRRAIREATRELEKEMARNPSLNEIVKLDMLEQLACLQAAIVSLDRLEQLGKLLGEISNG